MVLPTLLYAYESWTVYSRHARRLNHFHTTCPADSWKADGKTESHILKQADLPSIHTLLQRNQARWAGHVVRMSDERLPKQLLYGQLSEGKRHRGRPKKRFKDSLKDSLRSLGIPHDTWETLATEKSTWRSTVCTGARRAEEKRTAIATQKRVSRKARAADHPTTSNTIHTCTTCGRLFRARIGLVSHQRTHQT